MRERGVWCSLFPHLVLKSTPRNQAAWCLHLLSAFVIPIVIEIVGATRIPRLPFDFRMRKATNFASSVSSWESYSGRIELKCLQLTSSCCFLCSFRSIISKLWWFQPGCIRLHPLSSCLHNQLFAYSVYTFLISENGSYALRFSYCTDEINS